METELTEPIDVYVVDDHEVVREGVRSVLDGLEDVRVVGVAGDVASGTRNLFQARPQVALVDVRLPDGSGVELIRDVRSRLPGTRCIIFTSYPDDEAFFQSVVAGAAGYIVKDAGRDELATAIRTVAAGGSLIDARALDELRARAVSLPPDDEFLAQLTGQERRILSMVAEAMTNREIALELCLAEKTVRNYVSNILAKVGMKNRTQLAAYVARTVR